MAMKSFTLTEKKALTADVFELHFESSEEFQISSGQFITFILPKIGGRAYSILSQEGNKTVLIIKRVSEEHGGRGGSMMICDIEVGTSLNAAGPAGHFVLKEEDNAKLFIGTGTGLVPLYNQILSGLERGDSSDYTLIFGVRTVEDLFYLEECKKIAEKFSNFECNLYLSREDSTGTNKGYVTDFLTSENVSKFEEVYICGAPAMVDSSVEKLEEAGMNEEKIFTEKY
ncbi:FAD-dependent oxidoreductase [Candidatus Gracilibacteria bacterium]|nr:FAD-dependent oxidoreductase [Candidatus Gracilibacteria bacterium]